MNKISKRLPAVAAFFVLCASTHVFAQAPTPVPFTQEAFDAAQKAGKPILVDIYATWCEVCTRQKVALTKIRAGSRFDNLVTFEVNFDTQRDIVRKFSARMQSTLIGFRGTREVYRSVGETQAEWIDDDISKAMTTSPAT